MAIGDRNLHGVGRRVRPQAISRRTGLRLPTKSSWSVVVDEFLFVAFRLVDVSTKFGSDRWVATFALFFGIGGVCTFAKLDIGGVAISLAAN